MSYNNLQMPPKYEEANPQQQQPGYHGLPAYGAQPVNGVPGYTTNGQQVVVITAPQPVYHHHPSHSGRGLFVTLAPASKEYKFGKYFLALLELAVLAIQIAMFALNNSYWFYWLWLVVIPAITFSVTLKIAASGYRCTKGRDIWYGIVWLIHVGAVASVYYGYYYYHYYTGTFENLLYTNMALSGAAGIVHFIFACLPQPTPQ